MFSPDRPIYRQIRDVIVDRVLTLGDGALLPSVRALATEAGVNPLTVAKAYQDLQASGLVRARKGVGLFVADGAMSSLLSQERTLFLTEEWPRVRARINQLGLDPADLLEQA
ncbi:GntR family transcriptional regulator [Sandarakinorhabdus sp.]|uniref:GntR family transcriptional regulator n=1 Tax=Sandarakinorhabdus sp. TaxID=1916663 RepID=UPI00333EBF45